MNTIEIAPFSTSSSFQPAALQQARSIYRTRLIFLALQGVHILALFSAGSTVRPVLLGISGLLCICAYAWLLQSELIGTGTDVVSPFVLYLCVALLVVGASPIWTAFAYANHFYELFSHGRFDVTDNLMDGHRLLVLGDWLHALGERFYQGVIARRTHGRGVRQDGFDFSCGV